LVEQSILLFSYFCPSRLNLIISNSTKIAVNIILYNNWKKNYDYILILDERSSAHEQVEEDLATGVLQFYQTRFTPTTSGTLQMT